MANQKPFRIQAADKPWIGQGDAPTKVRIKRLINKGEHGSDLLLGVCEMDPGEETNWWSFKDENDLGPDGHWYGPRDETYYCLKGRLRLKWDDGEIEFGPGDAIYLAPQWNYHLANIGDEAAYFVYHMAPAPA